MVRIWLLFSLGREERRYFAAWVGGSHAANGSGPDGPVFAIGGLCTKGRRILWGELWVMRHNEACCPALPSKGTGRNEDARSKLRCNEAFPLNRPAVAGWAALLGRCSSSSSPFRRSDGESLQRPWNSWRIGEHLFA